MAYDPKRARGHRAPAPAADHQEVPAPVDGLLDGRIEHPAELDEPLPSAVADEAAGSQVLAEAPDPGAGDGPGPAPAEPEPEREAEPAVAAAPAPATPTPSPAPSEPPVAPVPDSAGSRWIFIAFLAAVVALIVWRLRRRSR